MYQGAEARLDYNILGNPGAGEAFLLNPQSAAANTFSQFQQDRLRYEEIRKLREQEAATKRRDLAIDNLKGMAALAAPFMADADYLKRSAEAFNKRGAEVLAAGGDPWMDEDFLNKHRQLYVDAELSRRHADEYNAGLKLISENPGKYRNVNEWLAYQTLPFEKKQELMRQGKVAPVLQKLYTTSDIADKVKAPTRKENNGRWETYGGDVVATHRMVDHILNDPDSQWVLANEFGVDPRLGGFGTKNKQGNMIYPTDDKFVEQYAKHMMEANAKNPNIFKAFGIDEDDPDALQKLSEIIKRQNNGYSRFTKEIVDLSTNKVNSGRNKDYRQGYYDIALAKLGMMKDDRDDATEEFNYYKRLRNDVVSGNPEAIERLRVIGSRHNVIVNDRPEINRIEVKRPVEPKYGHYWAQNALKQWIQKPIPAKPQPPEGLENGVPPLPQLPKGDKHTNAEINTYKKNQKAWADYQAKLKAYEKAINPEILYRIIRIKKNGGESETLKVDNLLKEWDMLPSKQLPDSYYDDPGGIHNDPSSPYYNEFYGSGGPRTEEQIKEEDK